MISTPIIETDTLDLGVAGLPYDLQLLASGGDGDYRWSITSGGLPAGLTFSSDGRLTGTPVQAGFSDFSVETPQRGIHHRGGLPIHRGVGQPSGRHVGIQPGVAQRRVSEHPHRPGW